MWLRKQLKGNPGSQPLAVKVVATPAQLAQLDVPIAEESGHVPSRKGRVTILTRQRLYLYLSISPIWNYFCSGRDKGAFTIHQPGPSKRGRKPMARNNSNITSTDKSKAASQVGRSCSAGASVVLSLRTRLAELPRGTCLWKCKCKA